MSTVYGLVFCLNSLQIIITLATIPNYLISNAQLTDGIIVLRRCGNNLYFYSEHQGFLSQIRL